MNSLICRPGDIVKKVLKAPFKVNSYAILAERLLLVKRYQCLAPQLFVMGLPRSGTTLIYQYIVHRLNVSYFTHGVGKFPYAACIATFIQHKLYGQYRSVFKSNYGKESGAVPVAPREAGGLWCRFFDANNYVEVDDLAEKDIYLLKNTIACVQNIFGGIPFVNKNVKHLLRIGALGKIFPNSRFLIVERDISDVAISILRGRYKNLSDPTQWWSVRPPNYKKLKDLPIAEQIDNQCSSLKQKMEYDLSKLLSEKVIRIRYEDFCNNPDGFIRKIMFSINATETNNSTRQCFKISHGYPQNQEESNLIDLVSKHRNE